MDALTRNAEPLPLPKPVRVKQEAYGAAQPADEPPEDVARAPVAEPTVQKRSTNVDIRMQNVDRPTKQIILNPFQSVTVEPDLYTEPPLSDDGDGRGLKLEFGAVDPLGGGAKRKRVKAAAKRDVNKKIKIEISSFKEEPLPFDDGFSDPGLGSSIHFFHFPQEGSRDLSHKYQCRRRCTRGFDSLVFYRQHFLRHDMESRDVTKAFACLRCFEFRGTSEQVEAHSKKDCQGETARKAGTSSRFTYFCWYCDTLYDSHELYTKHLRSKHQNEQVFKKKASSICAGCGLAFFGKFNYGKHILYNGPLHAQRCCQCDFEISSWQQHSNHLKEAHGGKFMHFCGHCGMEKFQDEADLKLHRRACHKRPKPRSRARAKTANGMRQCDFCVRLNSNLPTVRQCERVSFKISILAGRRSRPAKMKMFLVCSQFG